MVNDVIKCGRVKRNKELGRISVFSVLVFLVIFLALISTVGCSSRRMMVLEWKEGGLYELLPKPVALYGGVTADTASLLEFDMHRVVDKADFENYVNQCAAKGFVQTEGSTNKEYFAVNAAGVKLTVEFDSAMEVIDVSLDASEAYAELPLNSEEFGALTSADAFDIMKSLGFIHVKLKEENVPHDSKYADYTVKSVIVDGKEFAAGDRLSCTLPVTVTYYKRSVTLDYSASYHIGKDYSEVEELMKSDGFKNVRLKEIYAAADHSVDDSMNGKTVSVSVNGRSDFMNGEIFSPTALVIICYYNLDVKMDVSSTELLGQTKENVYQRLSGMGFKNVRLVPTLEGGDSVSYLHNGTVSKITIGSSDSFSVNDSFDRNGEVTVTYYKLDIAVGRSSKEIKGDMHYTEAEEYLRGLGFVNIRIEVSKELITGIINRPYEIKSITINGDSKFDAEDIFHHDHEIVIVYYDYKE